MFGPTPRGNPVPSHRQGTRAKRRPRRPHVKPIAQLGAIETKILAALEGGPKTLGELSFHHLGGLKAEIRDQAVESLLKAGRVRLATVPHPQSNARPLVALALPKGGEACQAP